MAKTIKIFNSEEYSKLLTNLKVIYLHKIEDFQEKPVLNVKLDELSISNTLKCSICKQHFENSLHQREHYKSDLHRYNLKLNLKGSQTVSEEIFEALQDVSSISGSDSDESEPDTSLNTLYQGKLYFLNDEGRVFSLFRCIIHEKKDFPENDDVLFNIVKQSTKKLFWTVLMIGGGHFAGAIYNGDEILVHKTFHLYTCRAKQGGAQYKEGNSKSAGAHLRRYNELALNQHVADLLQNWQQNIEKSHLIFIRAAGPFNKNALFGGKTPILKKNDPRLRTIPFCTKRATFKELKRVHDKLATIEIYDSLEAIKNQFFEQKSEESPRHSRRASPNKNKNINRAKSRESKEFIRPIPGAIDENFIDADSSTSDDESELTTDLVEISFEGLVEYEATKKPKKHKKKFESGVIDEVIDEKRSNENLIDQNLINENFVDEASSSSDEQSSLNIKHLDTKKPKKKKPKKKDRVKKWLQQLKSDLINACIKGNVDTLKSIIEKIKQDPVEDAAQQITAEKALNFVIDELGNTVLHLAALNNQNDLILWLLENNSDPCSKNDKMQTPYTINSDKDVRNVFRTFAINYPEKYNYSKSQIPIITSTQTIEELTEKKKAQRKAKRDREKEKKKENDVKRKEEQERDRYLKLSDREKRALAAERRMLAQTSQVLVRCFLCAEDISGKVPFEYSGNRFCSISCLKAHRLQQPILLS